MMPEYREFKNTQGWQDGNDEPRVGENVKRQSANTHPSTVPTKNITIGWRPTCTCFGEFADSAIPQPCTVLDPFSGSGTTGRVAIRLGRRYIGVDVSQVYHDDIAAERLGNIQAELPF